MKLAFVYFTYRNDQTLLGYSIESLKRLSSRYDIDVYVVDDSTNSMKTVPEGVIYKKSSFKRNGNLNGLECLSGMIDIYKWILGSENYVWVIKIDPDVYVNDLSWMENLNPNDIYQVGSLNVYRLKRFGENEICHGCFHGISRMGVENLITNFNTGTIRIPERETYRVAEDYMSCRLICNGNCNRNYYPVNYTNNPIVNPNENGLYFDFKR